MQFQKGHPWIYSILKWKDSAGLGIYRIYINTQILIKITVSLYNFVLSITYDFYKPTPLRSYWCGMRNMSTWNSFPFIALRSCICKRPAIEEMGDRREHRRDGRGSENNKCSGLQLRNYILNSYYPFCHSKWLCKIVKLKVNKLNQYVYVIFKC